MKRGEATRRVETVVENAIAGGEYAELADTIWVLGSYVAGALNVNDVDLLVEHRSNERLDEDALHWLSYGGNPYRGLDRELRGTWRNVDVIYARRGRTVAGSREPFSLSAAAWPTRRSAVTTFGGFDWTLARRRGSPSFSMSAP